MDRKRHKHQRKKRKYSSSKSRPSSSISISVSKSPSSEKVPRYRPRNHDNTVLLIDNLPEDVSKAQLESAFNDAAIEANVIPHEDISFIQAFGQAYIKYCTIDYARKVLIYLKGKINIGAHQLAVDFYNDSSGRQNKKNRQELKDSFINQPPTSYDWICDKCGYENFAKRHKCNKCLNPRNINCKILSVMMAPTGEESLSQNTSLMIKAKAIADASESEILDIFSSIASVKDIRLVKNKIPRDPRMKEQKDFAFVEFYSVEDTENVFRYVTQNEVRLRGDQLIIQYSRNNRSARFDDPHHAKPFGFLSLDLLLIQPAPPQFVAPPLTGAFEEPQILPPPQVQQQIQQTLQAMDVQILQPIIQAPYQTAQLAQERIIIKNDYIPPQPLYMPTNTLPKKPMPSKPHKKPPAPVQQQQTEQVQQEIEEEEEEEEQAPPPPPPKKVEPVLTEAQMRKKAELEMKKWEKQQQQKKPAETKVVVNKVVLQEQRFILYICPVCRKKFQSEEILVYHIQFSDLHKMNLKKLNIY